MKVFGKENDQKTAEVVQEPCTDEIVDAPVVVQCCVEIVLDKESDLETQERRTIGRWKRFEAQVRFVGI